MPQGFVMRRTRGWRMPPGSSYVGRPLPLGNPWGTRDDTPEERALALKRYRRHLQAALFAVVLDVATTQQARIVSALRLVRGRDLGCWCPLGAACHRDIVLDLANLGGPHGNDATKAPGLKGSTP